MDRLIELLNEYEDFQWYIDDYGRISEGGWWSEGQDSWICSKKFGFIKRLVENNKIDRDKINCERPDYTQLLMQLAIQDNPIKFLISILK